MKTNLLKLAFTLSVLLSSFFALTQVSPQTLTNSGTYTVPCGVNSITVKCWGGGGAGSGDNTNNTTGGAGGGGGGYCLQTFAVVPGQTFAYSVGAGGVGTSADQNAHDGGNTTFGTMTAYGGKGGAGTTPGTVTGTFGTATGGSTNTNGSNGVANVAGAGGAGGACNGGGGAGGAGGADGSSGSNGAAPGGGGGGAGDATVLGVVIQAKTGGSGGAGSIVITWVVSITYGATNAGVDQTLAGCAMTTNLNATALTSAPAGFEGTGSWSCVTNCGGVSITTPSSPTSSVSGLTVPNASTFRWTVTRAGCTTTTDDVIINTTVGPLCPVYCAEGTMSCAANDGLTNVTFSTINANSTACANGVAACVTVTAGNSYSFSATSGTGTGNHSLAVYCDWNSNGSFADAGEFTLIANNNMAASSTKSGTITVPAGATCGATIKMRVVYVYSTPVPTSANSCSNFTYGETEDYCMIISCCVPDCGNSIQDCNELGVDCGGPCGSACPGVPSCTNSILDQDETGVDCGGSICNPCGAQCSTFSNATSVPPIADDGTTVIDATSANQTITTCVEVTYSNRGTNWLHGVFMNPGSTGFVSTNATGALPEPNTSGGVPPRTYQWSNQTTNFVGDRSGLSITQNGWFVETSDPLNSNPGNNLGWPVGAGTTFGPFCFTTVVGCAGLSGDNNAFMNFQTTGDSYSGSWTTVDCGKESSFGDNAFQYILRCPVVLPVELLSFSGNYQGRSILLNWTTASEENSDYFIVLKSPDGKTFEELAKVKGAGTSTQKNDYSTIDNSPINPITYYKVRQTDFSGKISESQIIAIISPAYFDELNVIPNPVSTSALVVFNSTVTEKTMIKIFDVSGKLFLNDEFESKKGINNFSFNTENFNDGIYFIEISNGFDLKNIKFVKQHN